MVEEVKGLRLSYNGEVVPAVRMTQRSKFASIAAQRYLACLAAMALSFKSQAAESARKVSAGVPLSVSVSIADKRGHVCDIDNLVKTVLDAAVHAGVIADDRWVDKLCVVRTPRAGDSSVVLIIAEM